MNKRILIKFPSRSRPEKFFACLENIISTIGDVDYRIVCSLDRDDVVWNNETTFAKLVSFKDKHPNIYPEWGLCNSKVEAVNRDVLFFTDWNILLIHSDDMHFIVNDWGKDVLQAFENYTGLVHFPDQMARERLITYPMMDREYYDIDGWVYNPKFESVYCDNYQQDLAVKRNRYKYVDKEILEHRHAVWGFGKFDELMKKNENTTTYAKDKQTYLRLKGSDLFKTRPL